MADIGSLLRETRIRNKIDITTVEEATKIRAKYLRALENEEWVVLPGPTYVKTFLRTYAQFLGLDPHLLVDEYSARFEEPEDLEVAGVHAPAADPGPRAARGPAVARDRRRLVAGGRVRRVPAGAGADRRGRGQGRLDEPTAGDAAPRRATTAAPSGRPRRRRSRSARARATCASRWSPARNVWVCVVDAKGSRAGGRRDRSRRASARARFARGRSG